jgi:hypothetical protein
MYTAQLNIEFAPGLRAEPSDHGDRRAFPPTISVAGHPLRHFKRPSVLQEITFVRPVEGG